MAVKRAVLWRVVLCTFLLQLCEAVYLNCTPTCKDNLMIYSIDRDFPPDVNLSSCDYSWINNDTVLANLKGKLPSVEKKSIDTLETKERFTNIVYKSHCELKTSRRLTNFKANCITSCSKEDHKAPLVPVGTIPAVLGGLAGLVIVAGVAGYFLYKRYKSRKENQSDLTCSCTQWGGRYMNVKVPDSPV